MNWNGCIATAAGARPSALSLNLKAFEDPVSSSPPAVQMAVDSEMLAWCRVVMTVFLICMIALRLAVGMVRRYLPTRPPPPSTQHVQSTSRVNGKSCSRTTYYRQGQHRSAPDMSAAGVESDSGKPHDAQTDDRAMHEEAYDDDVSASPAHFAASSRTSAAAMPVPREPVTRSSKRQRCEKISQAEADDDYSLFEDALSRDDGSKLDSDNRESWPASDEASEENESDPGSSGSRGTGASESQRDESDHQSPEPGAADDAADSDNGAAAAGYFHDPDPRAIEGNRLHGHHHMPLSNLNLYRTPQRALKLCACASCSYFNLNLK
jgi:hypothetical protein